MNKRTSDKSLALIICNYNGKTDTRKCLDSLSDSVYQDFRVILVDDCSTDSSEKVDKKFEEVCRNNYSFPVEVLTTSENMGFAGANNFGISKALQYNPGYIGLLNNDTTIAEDALEIMVSRLNNSNKTVVGPKIMFMDQPELIWSAGGEMDEKIKIAKNRGLGQVDNGDYDNEEKCFYLSFCACIMPSDIFHEGMGMLDESYYMYGEDVDYCIRLRQNGYTMLYIPEAIVWHKGGATGVSASKDSLYYSVRNECIIREKYISGGRSINEQLLAVQKQKYYAKKVIGRDASNNKKMIEAIEAWKKGERGKRG